jgi:hypothetical protein
VAHSNTFEPGEDYTFTGVDIGDGIYLDTLVQFTAADDEFQPGSLAEGDKIAISYVEHDAVLGNDDEVVEPGYTNFVIRAGQIVQGSLIQNNYFAAVPAGFNKEDWHRLTVRSIALSETQAAFVIYLDGDPNKALAYPTSVDAGFATPLNGVAANYYNAEKHALYPSAVGTGDNITKISAASFSGTGALDDVVFTATKPSFITEQARVTIAWTEGVATVKIGNAEAIECTGAGNTVVDLPANGTVLVTATFAAGYEAGTYTVAPPGAQGSWDSTTGGFVNLADGNVCTIVAVQPKFDVAGVHYDNLADALAAAIRAGTAQVPATLKLMADYDQSISFTEGNIVLDLAGYDIQGGELDLYSIINNGATLCITNSGSEASVKMPIYELSPGVLYADGGFTTIQAAKFEGYIRTVADQYETFDNAFIGITGGTFYAPTYDPGDKDSPFYLAACVAQGLSYTKVGDYVQIGEGSPIIGTYTVTVTPTANATYAAAYKVGGETITPANDVLTVTVGQTIVITATPAANYEYATTPDGWTAGQDGAITIEVSAAGTVAIPAPTPVETPTTFALTTTGGANAVVTTDPADVSALTAATEVTITATPNTGYTYTGVTLSDNWSLNSETGVISKTLTVTEDTEVAVPNAASAGGKTYPSYIDDTTKEGKYDAWKAAMTEAGVDVGDGESYKDAYLLNCAPANVNSEKAAFKFTSITQNSEGEWVVETTTKNTANADYNGTVTIKRYSDVGCTSENENGSFFKAELK